MEDQIREALQYTLIREHQLTGIRLSRATTHITCKCGAEFTGPDWWTRHLVEEASKAVEVVTDKFDPTKVDMEKINSMLAGGSN